MNSLIGDSRVRGLKSGKLANLISDVWCLPGAKLSGLEDNIRDCVIFHHGEDEYEGKLNIYIAAGICDLTTGIKSHNYEEVIFDTPNMDSTIARVKRVLTDLNATAINQNAIPIFCTIYPMSLKDWNSKRLKQKKTSSLAHTDEYNSMQKALETSIDTINNFIYELNKNNQRSTPNLNNVLRHNRGKGNHSFKYNMLSDGCHPKEQLKKTIKDSLVQAIKRNRRLKYGH